MKKSGYINDGKEVKSITCEVCGEMADGTKVWIEVNNYGGGWYTLRNYQLEDGSRVNIFFYEGK